MLLAPLLCTLLALLAPPSGDPVARLATWTERARLAPTSVDLRRQDELRAILGELRLLRSGAPDEIPAIESGLVTLAAFEWREGARPDGLLQAARLARTELEDELRRNGARLRTWLAREVLAAETHHPRPERRLALELLLGGREPELLPTLRAAAGEDDAELAHAAEQVLLGWPERSVHELFLARLEAGGAARLAGTHFERCGEALTPDIADRLEHLTGTLLMAADWRSAARATRLVRCLATPRAVPLLLEALELWDRRTREGSGSRRIRHELVGELERRSARALGNEPARWREWWQAVSEGRVELPEAVLAAGGGVSRAAFFGLQAESDRVLFVLDRSGSMRQTLGSGPRTRHEEALEQLIGFLRQSGPETRFGVALFSDGGVAWRTRLSPASDANLELVRRWVQGKPPDGETMLFEGLRAGLGLDARGQLNLERCEVDTVIVLCDGATTEGPGWVVPWLAANEAAELVFHCVEIGTAGNGTLQALARESGGELVHVDG